MAAACMAGSDPARIQRLPDSSGMANRFLVQRTRRNNFDHAIETAGGRLVEIDPTLDALRDELSRGGVAAVSYVHAWVFNQPCLPLDVCARAAHEFSVPLILDAAAEVPPVQNLSAFIQQGADLVVFSGGKDLRGPQASGLILGGSDLVQACAANDSPNASGIARGMKVGKEEIAGLVKAVERYVNLDHAALMAQYDRKISFLLEAFSRLKGVWAERALPLGVGQQVPHVVLRWDEQEIGLSTAEVTQRLRSGKPPVAVRQVELAPGQPEIWVCVQTLQEGEERVVSQRIVDVIQSSSKLN
jgi:D-glucosaminate-6-phosphate ammonia-lyase